jgi:hypothetical protein
MEPLKSGGGGAGGGAAGADFSAFLAPRMK